MPEKESPQNKKPRLMDRLRSSRVKDAPLIKGFDRILVSVDFSMASKRAILLAQTMMNPNGILYAIHVTPDIVESSKEYIKDISVKDIQKQITHEALDKLAKWVKKSLNVSINVEYVVGAGNPAREIIKAARSKGAQIIVMGVHGKTRADLGIMGSTVDKVVRRSDCPVICVPPERV